jgi:outer membrane lipoprotein-sorting protein
MKKTGLSMLFLVYILTNGICQNAKEIIIKSRENSKVDGFESVSTLTIIDNKGNERIRKTTMASRTFENGKVEKRIIKFISPADVKGTGLLIYDYDDKADDMWIYMPSVRKSRRIVSNERGNNFMGSEFSNDDMSSPNINDFSFTLLNNENLNGTECFKIEAIPVNTEISENLGLSKKIIYIAKSDYIPRKTIIYDLDGELLKTITVENVQLLDAQKKKYMVTKMTVVNNQNGRKSVMNMDQLKYNPAVPEKYFTVSYLETN